MYTCLPVEACCVEDGDEELAREEPGGAREEVGDGLQDGRQLVVLVVLL
jgi:hypothetical protein